MVLRISLAVRYLRSITRGDRMMMMSHPVLMSGRIMHVFHFFRDRLPWSIQDGILLAMTIGVKGRKFFRDHSSMKPLEMLEFLRNEKSARLSAALQKDSTWMVVRATCIRILMSIRRHLVLERVHLLQRQLKRIRLPDN